MTKTQTAALSFLVPIAGIILFFSKMNNDRPAAFWALMWAMPGLVAALVLIVVMVL